MWGHAFSQRLSSIHRPNHLLELLQAGTYRKPLPQQSSRRFDYMQVLRRSRAHKERLSEKYKSLWTVQSTRAHRTNVPPPTGICASRKTTFEVATSSTGTKAASTCRIVAVRNLWTGQHPRVQMGMRKLWWTRHRRRGQCHKMPKMFCSKSKKDR